MGSILFSNLDSHRVSRKKCKFNYSWNWNGIRKHITVTQTVVEMYSELLMHCCTQERYQKYIHIMFLRTVQKKLHLINIILSKVN